MDNIRGRIRDVPDWPKKGIVFKDITPLLSDPKGLRDVTKAFKRRYGKLGIDKVVGIEARGFITGTLIATAIGVGFVPIRKKDKLPGQTTKIDYSLEYGTDTLEIHTDAIREGDRVLLTDDLLATGGTALAACRLIERLGGKVVECAFIISLPRLGGAAALEKAGIKPFSLIELD